jgi:hypothetical protein
MRNVIEPNIPFGTASSREISRRRASGTDEIVGASKFGRIAKIVWPFKTAYVLAELGKTSQRSAERWLSGEHEPPAGIVAHMLVEILKRE